MIVFCNLRLVLLKKLKSPFCTSKAWLKKYSVVLLIRRIFPYLEDFLLNLDKDSDLDEPLVGFPEHRAISPVTFSRVTVFH